MSCYCASYLDELSSVPHAFSLSQQAGSTHFLKKVYGGEIVQYVLLFFFLHNSNYFLFLLRYMLCLPSRTIYLRGN